MDNSILLLSMVIAAMLVLFISNRIRLDLVAIVACLALAWLSLISPLEAISGFASNAVVAMASVMILGYGIERTGVTSRLASTIIKYAGMNEKRIISTVSMTVGLLSSVMQNIGAAALFLPAIRRIGQQTSIPTSHLMMPMGFAAILGGTVTMIGSGPLIVLNDLLRQNGMEPFSMFAVTPVGLPLLLAGVALFALAGSRIFPNKKEKKCQLTVAEIWGIDYAIKTCILPRSSNLSGKTREEASFKIKYDLNLLAIRKNTEVTVAPSRYARLESGQELAFLGSKEDFNDFISASGCVPTENRSRLKSILDSGGFGLAELIVRPKASIIDKTLREIGFRQKFSIEPIVHYSKMRESRSDFYDTPLAAGDTIIAFGSWDTLRLLASHQDLLLLTHPEGEEIRYKKGPLAVMIFIASLALTFTGMPISIALLTGAVAMILAEILTPDEAYHAIDWKSVILIGGLIPFGIAMENTGASRLIASSFVDLLAGAHPIAVMLSLAILTTALSLIISNVAATVLLVPLVLLLSAGIGADPRALALLVAVSSQNSFILPTHQVNALLMDPGGYTIRDYLKAGGVMTVLFICIETTFIYLLI